jgi:DNA polymerase III alpha subunit (gram-positive type)
MNINKDKYIIVEIIPTHSDSSKGDIIQLSALKLKGFNLIDRFDYRLNNDLITNKDLVDLISYDNDKFIYVNEKDEIIKEFIKWSKNLPLLILDNKYTNSYLSKVKNKKESIAKYLDMDYSDDLINNLIKKYNLEYSNYIVDLLYESLILHENEKKS